MKAPWFKVYRNILSDEKIAFLMRRYGHETLSFWIGLMSKVNPDDGVLYEDDEIFADLCQLESKRYLEIRGIFLKYGLVVENEDHRLVILNWKVYQLGESTERVRQYRERQKAQSSGAEGRPREDATEEERPSNGDETLPKRDGNGQGTTDIDIELELDSEKEKYIHTPRAREEPKRPEGTSELGGQSSADPGSPKSGAESSGASSHEPPAPGSPPPEAEAPGAEAPEASEPRAGKPEVPLPGSSVPPSSGPRVEAPTPAEPASGAPGEFSMPRAVFDAWAELGERVYQPGDFATVFAARWGELRRSIRGIHSDEVLAAIRNFGSIVAGPPGQYYWNQRITLQAFFEKHLEKFLPANFREDDFRVHETRYRSLPPKRKRSLDELDKLRAARESIYGKEATDEWYAGQCKEQGICQTA